jgi:predicted nuclease of predicted toxin-antitoxin system
VRLFIDECLSPSIATRLNETGRHDAVHPLHLARRGEPDHQILARCTAEDRVIVTENARDFRQLVAGADLHPDLMILPSIDRDGSWRSLQAAIAFIEARGDPMNEMVNHVLEIGIAERITLSPLPD